MATKKEKVVADFRIVDGPSVMSLMISLFDGKRIKFTIKNDTETISFSDGVITQVRAMTPERTSWKIGGIVFKESGLSFFFSATYITRTRKGEMRLTKRV